MRFRRNAFTAAVLCLAACVLLVGARTALQAAAAATPPVEAFFDDSQLHSIYLSVNSRDWESLREHYLENTYYPGDLRWQDQVVRNIGIRSRGTGSRSGIKPGLRVDIDHYTTSQKFLGTLKSFILRNQTQDASGMHERLSMLMFRRVGVPAVREAHTRLYVNNAFAGLYTIVESVDKAYLRRTFDEDEGYLYKYDYNTDDEPYYMEYRGSNPDLYVPHPFKPETHESDSHPNWIAELIRVVNQDSDTIFRTTIAPLLDIERFVRHIAIENFLADQDGTNGNYGTNNFYLYRFAESHVFNFIPWDKSEAFKDGPTLSIWHNIQDGAPSDKRNRLTQRALRFPDLRSLYLETLAACGRSASELDEGNPDDTRGWLEREIQKEYDQIREAMYADQQKTFSNEQFEEDVEKLKEFARKRPIVVKTAVDQERR
jgi:spore coat protein CotH